ncbi:DUF2239 family protein [Acetobacteraceae bacterium KSS8]|uniref:DUF2239 family protein n=1 Tax=Endosaccharibacter trunci TaxID=2812733 RepID=A0ABT1WBJ9_9PROT|nr:DUF2239 family protein [Acetobacteraceae bacterium KSS8]
MRSTKVGARMRIEAVAFSEGRRIAQGALDHVAALVRSHQQSRPDQSMLVFDRRTGEVIDLDLRGTPDEVAARYAVRPARSQRGRPALGVVAREITLLPRHWDWLGRQPGGASATLRRLVEAARRSDESAARGRMEAAYRLMAVLSGDRPGFEEASRLLFAGDRERFAVQIAAWPVDIVDEILRVLDDTAGEGSFGSEGNP